MKDARFSIKGHISRDVGEGRQISEDAMQKMCKNIKGKPVVNEEGLFIGEITGCDQDCIETLINGKLTINGVIKDSKLIWNDGKWIRIINDVGLYSVSFVPGDE